MTNATDSNTAVIFEIKHFAVHDGPGIRTTVFFKGCPLKCVWCHNPEGLTFKSELAYLPHKCVNCGRCVAICDGKAHYFDSEGIHRLNREKCVSCGKCQSACYNNCLTLYGKTVSVDSIIDELMEDKDFYDCSNGGITLSGGECLMQPDAVLCLLKKAKALNLHTAVDTCGFTTQKVLDDIMPFTDLFLYDIKAIDDGVHIKCTGQSNKTVLENLKYISERGGKSEIRIPFVPDYNSGEIDAIGKFLSGLDNITGVRVLPYHNFAETKYKSLSTQCFLPERVPTDEEIENARKVLSGYGLKVLV